MYFRVPKKIGIRIAEAQKEEVEAVNKYLNEEVEIELKK